MFHRLPTHIFKNPPPLNKNINNKNLPPVHRQRIPGYTQMVQRRREYEENLKIQHDAENKKQFEDRLDRIQERARQVAQTIKADRPLQPSGINCASFLPNPWRLPMILLRVEGALLRTVPV
jgi:hypothetical protein